MNMVDLDKEERYIEGLATQIKAELFSPSMDVYSLLPVSPYDTAWVATVADPQQPKLPMFPQCLDWILRSQSTEGFWGNREMTVQCLIDTLACVVALKTWNVGTSNIEQGLLFLRQNMEKLMSVSLDECSAISLPGMIELAQEHGLEVLPLNGMNDFSLRRDLILGTMRPENPSSLRRAYLPLELYLEVLPARYKTMNDFIMLREQLARCEFRSPAAAASAFLTTGEESWLKYLKTLVQRCGAGVPPIYPVDEDHIKLCVVDHLERLGCSEHFEAEIHDVIDCSYRNWMEEQQCSRENGLRVQIYKDSFTFRLLRLHGYDISPGRFCWFVHDDEMLSHMEEKHAHYLGAMHHVYKASHLVFLEEDDLEKAKDFSRKIMQKSLSCPSSRCGSTMLGNLQSEIEHELKFHWLDGMDHLEHRRYIERNQGYTSHLGRTSSIRLSFQDNVTEMAKKKFMLRQFIYRTELEDIKRWSRDTGLSNMGFGREKTTYCFFLSATAICFPLKSNLRKVLAKSGILITVADDFFDEKGTLDELRTLTESSRRWDGKGLSSHAKVIFEALDEHITEAAIKSLGHEDGQIKQSLREIWQEIFDSWMKESTWSRRNLAPTMTEYLDVGMVSIGIQAMVFPLCYLLCPNIPDYLVIARYNTITKLLMLSTRLLNDIQSYQREAEDGKINMALLYLKENQHANINDSISFIRNILNVNEKILIELLLSGDNNIMSREWKVIHLLVLKIFHMLFNSGNAYDSPTTLLDDINKAIYNPLKLEGDHFVS